MVSVIVATYRRDIQLKKSLESLENQTYKDIEIILVDDNADLQWNNIVKSIVDEFIDKIKIVLIQNKPNLGSAKSRDLGISRATGEFITFLDDDDIYFPNKIENQIKQMQIDDSDFCIMNLLLYNDNEKLDGKRERPYLLTGEKEDLLLCHLKYHLTGTDTMMFKKDYLLKTGGFGSTDVGDEFYLMMNAILQNGKLSYCNTFDVKAYVHEADKGISSGLKKISGEKKLYKFKKNFFKKISKKDQRYIKVRHHAVMAYAYKNNKKIFLFIIEGIKAVFVDPFKTIKLVTKISKKESF